MERAFQKARLEADKESTSCLPEASPPNLPTSTLEVPLPQAQAVPALSPDVSVQGDPPLEATSVFPSVAADTPPPASHLQSPPQDSQKDSAHPTGQGISLGGEQELGITPALATLIAESIRQGIAQGLQQKAPSEVSSYVSRHGQSLLSHPVEGPRDDGAHAPSPDRISQDSRSDDGIMLDQDLSEDEGLEPNQPSFVGLFRPQMF